MAIVNCICGASYQVPDNTYQAMNCPTCGQIIQPPPMMASSGYGQYAGTEPVLATIHKRKRSWYWSFGLATAILLCLGIGAALVVFKWSGSAVVRDTNWRNYQSKEGYFAIDLPQEPELNVVERSGVYHTISVDMGKGGGRYFVTYRDFPKDYHLKGQNLVDDEANMLITNHSGHGADQLERRKVCDQTGCHFSAAVRMNGKDSFLFGRLCVRYERVFIVYWMGPSRKGAEHLDRFFSSFELTKDPNKKSFAERVRDRVNKQSD